MNVSVVNWHYKAFEMFDEKALIIKPQKWNGIEALVFHGDL